MRQRSFFHTKKWIPGKKACGVFSLMTAALTIVASHELEAAEAPVKVYILAGQSNMVGIGQVSGSSSRWGDEFIDPVLSVYEGACDPSKNYDDLTPIQSKRSKRDPQ